MKNLPVSPFAPDHFPALPAVGGVVASATRVGFYGGARNDLMVAVFPDGASVAGAFTRSATRSADVIWCAEKVVGGKARALVVNAGNSNAFTGPAGVAKNQATLAEMAALIGCAPEEIFLSATGVIGAPIPPRMVADALPAAVQALAQPDWEAMARAFATTDTFPKAAGAQFDLDGITISMAGLAKGSGMIAPNMATMLVYVFCDLAISAGLLQALVSRHVATTFNAITVDSDTSTSDTLLVFATGAAGNAVIDSPDDPRLATVSEALHGIFHDLALQVVKDGEGGQKLIEITVTGAASDVSARTIAMSIANSPLVKTAIAGEDANWGRVVMAVGKAGEPINMDALSVRFCGIWTARHGARWIMTVPP